MKFQNNKESYLQLIQDIYRDCVTQKKKILTRLDEREKTLQKVHIDADSQTELSDKLADLIAIAQVDNSSLKELNSIISQKMMILKIHKDFLKVQTDNSGKTDITNPSSAPIDISQIRNKQITK